MTDSSTTTDDGAGGADGRGRRSTAEWVTFGFSCAVVGVVVALLLTGLGGEQPPAPEARPHGPVEQVGGSFHVTIEVQNTGDGGASDVQVHAELTVGDEVYESDVAVDFLAADQRDEVLVVFPVDPSSGELDVRVTGYREP